MPFVFPSLSPTRIAIDLLDAVRHVPIVLGHRSVTFLAGNRPDERLQVAALIDTDVDGNADLHRASLHPINGTRRVYRRNRERLRPAEADSAAISVAFQSHTMDCLEIARTDAIDRTLRHYVFAAVDNAGCL